MGRGLKFLKPTEPLKMLLMGWACGAALVWPACATAAGNDEATLSGCWVVLHAKGLTPAEGITLAADGRTVTLTATNGPATTLPLSQVAAMLRGVTPGDPKMPTGSGPYCVEFISGERLRLNEFTLDDRALTGCHVLFGELTWPRRQVKRLVRADRMLTAEPPEFTGLRFRNGDTMVGKVESVANGVAMVSMSGVGKIPVTDFDSVWSMVLAQRPAGRRKSFFVADPGVEVLLKNGDVVAGTLTGAVKQAWHIKPAWLDKPLAVPAAFIRAVCVGGPSVYLSDLTPEEHQTVPYLGFALPWQRDRSLLETLLRVGAFSAHRGIALHTQTELHYRIEGMADAPMTLVALAGLDESVRAAAGSARIAVAVDGTVRFDKTITTASQPLAVRVEIPAQAKRLTVSSDFAEGGSIGDHVDLLYAAIVRE
jgi:hypothetical protein